MSPGARLLVALAGAALSVHIAACAGGSAAARGELTGERRAALARVIVDNRTELRLEIAFRYAVDPGGEVGVGQVGPGARTEVAPVPADEPIIMIARAAAFERRLAPRSFEIDEVWVWIIQGEASDAGG